MVSIYIIEQEKLLSQKFIFYKSKEKILHRSFWKHMLVTKLKFGIKLK